MSTLYYIHKPTKLKKEMRKKKTKQRNFCNAM